MRSIVLLLVGFVFVVGAESEALQKLVRTPDGIEWKNFALSKSKLYVVEHFAPWCGGCVANASNVNDLADTLRRKKLNAEVLDLGNKESDEDYLGWVKRTQPNHTVVKDVQLSFTLKLRRKNPSTSIPATYVIRGDGTVLYHNVGVWDSAEVNDILDLLEREAKPAAAPYRGPSRSPISPGKPVKSRAGLE